MGTDHPKAAYVHIPFCVSKCHYCEFNSYPGLDFLFSDYVDALVMEIERVSSHMEPAELDTVYFGGGTPTILPPADLSWILFTISDNIGIAPGAEVTTEANPGTVDQEKLSELRRAGFNRVSLGVQSFDDSFLARIGRAHSISQALDAYSAIRRAGFANVGIDLMFALPGQTVDIWECTLAAAVGLGPEHISLYELSIEEGTRFAELCAEGVLELPDEDEQIVMYELAIEKLTAGGYEHYEVSNFARPGFRSRHNQVYWRNDPYYGFGAGATGYVDGDRSRRIAAPSDYIRAISSGSDAIEFTEHLTGRAYLSETIIQGLRMLEGIDLNEFERRTGVDITKEFATQVNGLRDRGLIEIAGSRIRVTHTGLLLLNDVSREFLS